MRKYLKLKLKELRNKEHLNMYELGQIHVLDNIFNIYVKYSRKKGE